MANLSTPPPLGPVIQQQRKLRRLTLDQLAAASGVSRSMLSQIERSEANPTFSTLWNITRALNLDLSNLIGGASSRGDAVEIVPEHATPEIRTGDGKCTLRILSPVHMAGLTEWYLLEMKAGGELRSDPHAQGTRENLTLLEGHMSVTSAGATAEVPLGGTARYAADTGHIIRNSGLEVAKALLVVVL